jgi:hypothetical protein
MSAYPSLAIRQASSFLGVQVVRKRNASQQTGSTAGDESAYSMEPEWADRCEEGFRFYASTRRAKL